MSLSEIVQILSAIYLAVHVTTGSPVRHKRSTSDLPWASPCEPTSSPSSGEFDGLFEPIEPSMSDLATELHLRSLEAHRIAMDLKNIFFADRLSSSQTLSQYLEATHFDNFPRPGDVVHWTNENDTGVIIKKDHINLSTMLVYLEAVKIDDIEQHNSTNKHNINSLEKKLLSVLCTLDTIMSSLGVSLDGHVARDVMPNSLREIPIISERNKRDYVVVKDCVHAMTATKDSHLAMKLGME